jgi:hypothetical protein
MKRLLIGLVVLVLAAGVANATRPAEDTSVVLDRNALTNERVDVFWFDNVESGVNGWTHGDWTATGGGPKWHLDTYMPYGGSGYSWWCGSFAYDTDGGYGNNWFEFLTIPPTDVSSLGYYAVWTFCYRTDSEPTYDFLYFQAESLGVYVDIGPGHDGLVPWTDIGDYGALISTYDNPFKGRYLFTSDGAWSDADGNNTVGGGCAVDNVKLFNPFTAEVVFYDDGETGGLCIPGQAGAAGDYWHIAYDLCSSYSRPHSWQCVNEADTTKLPPLMQNWLDSPWISFCPSPVPGPGVAKWHAKGHFEIAGYYGDYWYVWATFDGVNYYTLKANYGDFGGCSGWSTSYNNGVELSTLTGVTWPQYNVQFEIAMYTDGDGTQPTIGGCAGIVFDDILLDGTVCPSPTENQSWGNIKSMFR